MAAIVFSLLEEKNLEAEVTSIPIIRLMRPADLPAALELWRSTTGVGLRSEDNLPTLGRFLARNSTSCFVLSAGEELVGTVLAGFDGRRGYIYHLAVRPRHRKHGYGRQLLDHAIKALRSQGGQKVLLFVFEDNQEAMAFYRRRGWNEREDLKVFDLEL